jgi:hypothetical protein
VTKGEYEAIKRRAEVGLSGRVGEARITIICVDVFGNPIHPDELGGEAGERFKGRAEAFALAARDRCALVKFIEEGFDIEWAEDRAGLALPPPAATARPDGEEE